jgi:replicative DNA helicase
LGAATVWLHDRPGLNCFEVRRCARRLKPRGLSLVVVDYLQRVTPDDRRAPRHLQVGQISGALKELARELEVPVLCLCQLSRAAEVVDKQGKIQRPRMSMLKESGDIEQDADMVLLLHRADVKSTEAELIVGKNRNGQVGQVFGLQWDGLRTRYARPLTATHAEFDAYSGQ